MKPISSPHCCHRCSDTTWPPETWVATWSKMPVELVNISRFSQQQERFIELVCWVYLHLGLGYGQRREQSVWLPGGWVECPLTDRKHREVLYSLFGIQSVADVVRQTWQIEMEHTIEDDWMAICRNVEGAGEKWVNRRRKTRTECVNYYMEWWRWQRR